MTAPVPAALLGHGNPMNALERNRSRGRGTAAPNVRQASV